MSLLSALVPFAALCMASSAPAAALIACPLATDQSVTYTCGCGSPKLEGTEPADSICCPYTETPQANPAVRCICPLNGGSLQPQATVCPCPTYCRADTSGTGGSSDASSSSSTVTTPGTAVTPPATVPLTTQQLNACQQAAPKLTAALNRMVSRRQSQLTLYTTIMNRVESYYTQNGKPYASHATLAANAAAAQQNAQDQLQSLRTTAAAGFDCTANDPHSAAQALVLQARAQLAALQDYRSAVRNLIIGIQTGDAK